MIDPTKYIHYENVLTQKDKSDIQRYTIFSLEDMIEHVTQAVLDNDERDIAGHALDIAHFCYNNVVYCIQSESTIQGYEKVSVHSLETPLVSRSIFTILNVALKITEGWDKRLGVMTKARECANFKTKILSDTIGVGGEFNPESRMKFEAELMDLLIEMANAAKHSYDAGNEMMKHPAVSTTRSFKDWGL